MTTRERELTTPVDLCTPDGHFLADSAAGWSRQPLHTANLRGGWGRTKRWDYWAVLSDEMIVSVVYADVDYLGIVSVWWLDPATGATGGRDLALPLARGVALPDLPGSEPLVWHGKGVDLELVDDHEGTAITAQWQDGDGTPGRFDLVIAQPPGHESLNVVIPWSQRRFQYTSKHQARPASGRVSVGGRTHHLGAEGTEAWGVLDVGRGRWPYRTHWNWAGGAGRSVDGAHTLGIQMGAKWTAGTGYTENGIIVDGRLHKLGNELAWEYSWERPLDPWHVTDPGGQLDLLLVPFHDKHSATKAVVASTEVHQVFGRWTGWIVTDEGERIDLDGILGFAEESRSRW